MPFTAKHSTNEPTNACTCTLYTHHGVDAEEGVGVEEVIVAVVAVVALACNYSSRAWRHKWVDK